jgi:hypothetical protein
MAANEVTKGASDFVRSNHSFSGVDIKAVFGGIAIGTIQAISYAVTREKAPIYTMGNPDPRAFSRGKRAIAGSMVFIMFDRDPILSYMQNLLFSSDKEDVAIESAVKGGTNIAQVAGATSAESALGSFEQYANGSDQQAASPWYADQIPPFDITLFAANEYGAQANMRIINVEITDEGHGMSVDDVQLGKQYKWIARFVLPWNFTGVVEGSPLAASATERTNGNSGSN